MYLVRNVSAKGRERVTFGHTKMNINHQEEDYQLHLRSKHQANECRDKFLSRYVKQVESIN